MILSSWHGSKREKRKIVNNVKAGKRWLRTPVPLDLSSAAFPVGWEWALMTIPSTVDYSRGFGGRYGVEKDKWDKAALGYDYKGETEKHESQRGKLGLERREVTEYHRNFILPIWKPTQRTHNTERHMYSAGGEVKSNECMCVGISGGKPKGVERKTD